LTGGVSYQNKGWRDVYVVNLIPTNKEGICRKTKGRKITLSFFYSTFFLGGGWRQLWKSRELLRQNCGFPDAILSQQQETGDSRKSMTRYRLDLSSTRGRTQ